MIFVLLHTSASKCEHALRHTRNILPVIRKPYIHVTVHRNNFYLNNQPDALIIQILFRYKTLRVSGNLFAHHQEFSTVHSALVSFTQVFDDRFQAESGNLPVPNVQ